MFTPLTIHKNRIEEVDRFDNSGVTSGTADKPGGYGVPSQNVTQGNNLDGTIITQVWPNSDDTKDGGGGNGQFFTFTGEGDTYSTWWSLSIPTADNQMNVGGGSDYPGVDNTLGVLKGQIGVSFRQRPSGGGNEDGIILLNSGSIYDWTDPQPITIAYSVDMTAGVAKASINGETATVTQINRTSNPDATDPLMFTNLTTTVSSPIFMTMGYGEKVRRASLGSGSYSQLAYYTSSLTQDELNVITGQVYGDTLNVLDIQPQFYYHLREENKEQTSGNTIPHQLNGVFAFPNEGTLTDSELAQIKTVNGASGLVITSGSVFDGGSQQYQERI